MIRQVEATILLGPTWLFVRDIKSTVQRSMRMFFSTFKPGVPGMGLAVPYQLCQTLLAITRDRAGP